MKNLKKIAALALIAATVLSLTSCFNIYKKIFNSVFGGKTEDTEPSPSAYVTDPAEGTKPVAPSASNRPTAEGIDKKVYDLCFYIPDGTVNNPYNGLLGVWEFYTEEYGMPGADITLMVSSLGDKGLEEYVKNDSRPAKSTGVTPFAKEKINGSDWYTCNNGTIWYFAGECDGYVYEIEVKSVAGDPDNVRDKAISLLRQTLYFEPEE
ncbi:MAG: hypothetical protein IKX86_04585 [Clostridia bacterium]|nr:hypothetical protein [Clostridia bacterium]MBR5767929.1 hypothetical protein [Clostridia bacterium]